MPDEYEELKELYGESNPNLQNMIKLWNTGEAGKNNWITDANNQKKYLAGDSILVVGCGVGGQVYGWKAIGWKATGLEINKWAVENAVTEDIVCSDIAKTPFKDNEFDSLLMLDVMEHVPLDFLDMAIKECERITKMVALFRIPFYSTQTLYSHFLKSGIIREHMHNRSPIFWSERLRRSFGDWTEWTDKVSENWTLYQYKAKTP